MVTRRTQTVKRRTVGRPAGLQRLLNWLPWLVLALLITPVGLTLVPGVVGGDHTFVVLTGSMAPAIAVGDIVVVERVDPAAIAVGDVVTFLPADDALPVTHRVVAVTETEAGERLFATKGDANEVADADPVPASSLYGRVRLVVPALGHVLLFGRTTVGLVTLVLAVPTTHFLLSTLLKRVKQ